VRRKSCSEGWRKRELGELYDLANEKKTAPASGGRQARIEVTRDVTSRNIGEGLPCSHTVYSIREENKR
jgi:hypothetical protein